MDKADKDKLWAELDTLGEDQVRENVGLGLYGTRRKGSVVEWLRQEEHKRTSRHDTPWRKTLLGKIIIGVVIAVVAGLGVLYLADLLGIPSTPITNK
jgi:predicted RNA-binding protein